MTDVLHGRLQIEHPPYVLERLFGLRFDPRRRAKDRVLLLESHSPHSPKRDRQNVPDHLELEGDALLNIVGIAYGIHRSGDKPDDALPHGS